MRKKGLAKTVPAEKQANKAMKGLATAFDLALPPDLRTALGGQKLSDVVAK